MRGIISTMLRVDHVTSGFGMLNHSCQLFVLKIRKISKN